MLDMTTTSAPIPAWGDTIQRGDVVLFRFPHAEGDANDAPKSRTCLVLDIETRNGRRVVELAYGTSVDSRINVGHEIDVDQPAEMAAAGVHKPTRFVGARRIVVGFDHEGWDINPTHPSPVIGRLARQALARMNAVRARIPAARDIAADRRAVPRRPFTVEHRRSRKPALRRQGVRS